MDTLASQGVAINPVDMIGLAFHRQTEIWLHKGQIDTLVSSMKPVYIEGMYTLGDFDDACRKDQQTGLLRRMICYGLEQPNKSQFLAELSEAFVDQEFILDDDMRTVYFRHLHTLCHSDDATDAVMEDVAGKIRGGMYHFHEPYVKVASCML